MQRIVCRYRKDVAAGPLNHGELRGLMLDAAARAGLPVCEGRRAIAMGPPLTPEATSDAEFVVLGLDIPRDPTEVGQALNLHLPPGLRIERAWIARRGTGEDSPSTLDEAVYDLSWQESADADPLPARVQTFLAAPTVMFTRVRELKTQHFNARALVRAVSILAQREGLVRLRVVLVTGPQGSLRPEEVPTVLGSVPVPGALRVQRIALQRSTWRHPSRAAR